MKASPGKPGLFRAQRRTPGRTGPEGRTRDDEDNRTPGPGTGRGEPRKARFGGRVPPAAGGGGGKSHDCRSHWSRHYALDIRVNF